MNPKENNTPVESLGLYLDPIGVQVGTSTDGYRSRCIADTHSLIPPAALLPHLSGEHLAADISNPPDIRGTGQIWPKESKIVHNGNSARFPIAYAWKYIIDKNLLDWQWQAADNKINCCTAYQAIAVVVNKLIEKYMHDDSQRVALVVPNSIDENIQDNLLNELGLTCPITPKLLWRPVAAALAWCEKYDHRFLTNNPIHNHSVGELLCLHLGFDGFEHCVLKLIPRQFGNEWFLLPARKLPQSGATLSPCIDVLDELVKQATNCDLEEYGYRWWTEWCTGFLSNIFKQYDQDSEIIDHRHFEPRLSTDNIEKYITTSSSILHDHKAWLKHLSLSYDFSRVSGVVVTGQLAPMRIGSRTFAHKILDQLGIELSSVNIYSEGINSRMGEVLPRGAAIFAQRVKLGLPPYLDTIPRVETIITKEGEPTWVPLIASTEEFVLGGQKWIHKPDSNDLPLSVGRGEEHILLTVWREGSENVREVDRNLSHFTEKETAVKVKISMFPGQGNPRVQVIPLHRGALGPKQIFLDWSRSDVKPYGKKEALEKEERTNPPCEPRKSSLTCWQGGGQNFIQQTHMPWVKPDCERVKNCSKQLLQLYHSDQKSDILDAVKKLRDSLRERDEEFTQRIPTEHATAVSSDGGLHPKASNRELLPELIDALVDLAGRYCYSKVGENADRCLGYCSTEHPAIIKKIHKIVNRTQRPKAEEFILLGNCLRDPSVIGLFVKNLSNWLDPPNDPLRALARILQYREDATREIPSVVATKITECCCRVAWSKLDAVMRGQDTRLSYIYRHASLCIVFLLRRRKYDSNYLPPDGQLAFDIKKLFVRVLRGINPKRCIVLIKNEPRYLDLFAKVLVDIKSELRKEMLTTQQGQKELAKQVIRNLNSVRKIDSVGGFVDPVHVTTLMIDYIDKRGKGRIGASAKD